MYLQAVDPDQVGSWLIWICSVLKKKDKPRLSMKVVNIHQLLCTVDSKIQENCCKQKIYTNSGNGFYISDFIWDFGKLPSAHLGKYIIKNGKISTKIHELGK